MNRPIIIILLVLLGLAISSHALALQLEYPDWFPIKEDMLLTEIVLALFNVFLVISGAAAFVSLVVAGFRYLTALADPAKLSDAKNQALNALIGLVLLFSCFLILNYIDPQLVELQEPIVDPTPEALDTAPGMLTARLVLRSPKQGEHEYMFAREAAEEKKLDEIEDKQGKKLDLKIAFEPQEGTLELFLQGSRQTIWKKKITGPTAEKIDWKDASGAIKIKATIIVAFGLPIYLERHDVGALEWVPFGQSVEATVNFLQKKHFIPFNKTIFDWIQEFADKTKERDQKNCAGGRCSHHHKICESLCEPLPKGKTCTCKIINKGLEDEKIECEPDGCCCLPQCAEIKGRTFCSCLIHCPKEGKHKGCCVGGPFKGWQPKSFTCQAAGAVGKAGSCNLQDPAKKPCGTPAQERAINTAVVALEQAKGDLQDPNFGSVFNKAKRQITDCLDNEEAALLSCKDAEIWLGFDTGEPRVTEDVEGKPVWPCEEGHDFICTWAEGEQEKALKIVFPIEYLAKTCQRAQELNEALYNTANSVLREQIPYCKCDNVNYYCKPNFTDPSKTPAKDFTCSPTKEQYPGRDEKNLCNCIIPPSAEEVDCNKNPANISCSKACFAPKDNEKDAPFPKDFADTRENALLLTTGDDGKCGEILPGASFDLGDLDLFHDLLDRSLQVISLWSAFDALDTCEETQSILREYLQSGDERDCPPEEIYPCCPPLSIYGTPVDDRIKNCSPADFFFCNPVTKIPLPAPFPAGKEPVQFPAEPFPRPHKWPMVCAPWEIKDCQPKGPGQEGDITTSVQWQDASQTLKGLIKCIYEKAPQDPGPISSISDSNIPGRRGGTGGCDRSQCKQPGTCLAGACGNPQKCQHSCRSWHYGGTCAAEKSYAVDLADESKYNMIRNLLIDDGPCGGADLVLFEGDHIHITVKDAARCLP